MRISTLFACACALPVLCTLGWGAGQGQDMSGDWHLNLEKSRWGAATRPLNVVVTIQQRGSEMKYQGAITYANEESRSFSFDGSLDGKPYRTSRSFGDGTITLRRIDNTSIESTFRTDDGLYTEITRTTISSNGRTLTRKLTMRAPDGTKKWTEIYDKR